MWSMSSLRHEASSSGKSFLISCSLLVTFPIFAHPTCIILIRLYGVLLLCPLLDCNSLCVCLPSTLDNVVGAQGLLSERTGKEQGMLEKSAESQTDGARQIAKSSWV